MEVILVHLVLCIIAINLLELVTLQFLILGIMGSYDVFIALS